MSCSVGLIFTTVTCHLTLFSLPLLIPPPGFLFVFIQISALVIYDTARGMEDVFNDSALDTVSLFEVMDHLSRMTSLVEDCEEEEEEEETQGMNNGLNNDKTAVKISKEVEGEVVGDAEEGRVAGEGNSQSHRIRIGIVRMGETEIERGPDPAAGGEKPVKGHGKLKVPHYKGGKHPPLPMPPLPTAMGIVGYGNAAPL